MQEAIFDLLDHWKKFPNYQLERRADIFFAAHLPQILRKLRQVETELILPEFPVRIGTIYPNRNSNQSRKIDYVIKVRNENRILFIELKTDPGSRNDPQDEYLRKAQDVGFKELLQGLAQIYEATSYKTKYQWLLTELSKAGIIGFVNDKIILPGTDYESEILYLQPKSEKSSEIGFDEIAGVLEISEDPLTRRFCKSLRNWAEE